MEDLDLDKLNKLAIARLSSMAIARKELRTQAEEIWNKEFPCILCNHIMCNSVCMNVDFRIPGWNPKEGYKPSKDKYTRWDEINQELKEKYNKGE